MVIPVCMAPCDKIDNNNSEILSRIFCPSVSVELWSPDTQEQRKIYMCYPRYEHRKNELYRFHIHQNGWKFCETEKSRVKLVKESFKEKRVMTIKGQVMHVIPKKKKAIKENGYLRRPYKELWKKENWKAKEKRKDIGIWMQCSKE